jgi:thiol-disulfide isomerase/thioredoxin
MKRIFNLIIVIFLPFSSLFAQELKNESGKPTYIIGHLREGHTSDTLYLVLQGQLYKSNLQDGSVMTLTSIPDKKGDFHFLIPPKSFPFHVALFLSPQRHSTFNLLNDRSAIMNYLIEPGDSVHVEFNHERLRFSGRGAALLKAQYAVFQTDPDQTKLNDGHTESFAQNPEQWMKQYDYMLKLQLDTLEAYRTRLNPLAYSIVRADIIGNNRHMVYHVANFDAKWYGKPEAEYARLNQTLQNLEKKPPFIAYDDPAALSPLYVEYLYNKIVVEHNYDRAVKKSGLDKYDRLPFIKRKYPEGVLRDKIVVRWIKSMAGFNVMPSYFLDSAMAVVKTQLYHQMLTDFKDTFSKGAEVVKFDFKDKHGKTVKLSDFTGKVLMVDMWFSGCGPCVFVAKGLPDVEKEFNDRKDMVFISLSTDKDQKQWLRSIDRDTTGKEYTHYTTDRTIYLNTGGTGTSNAFIKRYALSGFPALLIIGKDGRVFSSKVSRPINNKGKAELIVQLKEALKD